MIEQIRVGVLIKGGPAPECAHPGEDAGYDLRSDREVYLDPGESAWVGTGVRLGIPSGMFALQCPRSGLACNEGITLANAPGVIDPGYRGEIRCKLVNLGKRRVHIAEGERVAQLVFLPYLDVDFHPVADSVETFEASSSRGGSGYGSTGKM